MIMIKKRKRKKRKMDVTNIIEINHFKNFNKNEDKIIF